MPLYEFECESCGEIFEGLAKSVEETPQCPKCGGPSSARISAPAPLKTGAFPFKPGPPMNLGRGGPCGGGCGSCGSDN